MIAAEYQHIIKLTQPNVWIGTEDFVPKFKELYGENELSRLVVFNGAPNSKLNTWDDLLELGKNSDQLVWPKMNWADETAFILFSSGTTGVPKGVTLTNQNLLASRRQNIELTINVPRNEDDVAVSMLPLFHIFGICSILDYFVRGLNFVLIPKFSMPNMLSAIQDHKVKIVFLFFGIF